MRFEEQFLTDGKADQNHSNNVSFGNCMLRIPSSLNSNQVLFNDKNEIIDTPPEVSFNIGTAIDPNKTPIARILYFGYRLQLREI